jgi:hypothetical protein
MWRKLATIVNVQTYDLQTGEISDFDERPKEDNNRDDNEQRFFWIAHDGGKDLKESIENKHPSTLHWYMAWLEGSINTPGGFRTSKYGEEGDL